MIAAAGVVATGVEGSSTGVCFENNVLEDTYAKLGSYTVSVTATDGSGDTVSNTVSGVETAGSAYTAYGPARILDTHNGTAAAGAVVALPRTSNLNFKTGQNVPNLVVVPAAPTA